MIEENQFKPITEIPEQDEEYVPSDTVGETSSYPCLVLYHRKETNEDCMRLDYFGNWGTLPYEAGEWINKSDDEEYTGFIELKTKRLFEM